MYDTSTSLFVITWLPRQVKELEQIEQMELETLAEALPTTKAIREKKMKMKETIDRVVKCYDKDGDKDMVGRIRFVFRL